MRRKELHFYFLYEEQRKGSGPKWVTEIATYDAVLDHDVTLRTPCLLHPSWQTERRTILIMEEGQYKRETQLCVRSHFHMHSKSTFKGNKRAKKEGNDANFSAQKNQYLENTKKICIFKNMRFILGDLRSNAYSYFFHFCLCLCHGNLVFLGHSSVTNEKMYNLLNLKKILYQI